MTDFQNTPQQTTLSKADIDLYFKNQEFSFRFFCRLAREFHEESLATIQNEQLKIHVSKDDKLLDQVKQLTKKLTSKGVPPELLEAMEKGVGRIIESAYGDSANRPWVSFALKTNEIIKSLEENIDQLDPKRLTPELADYQDTIKIHNDVKIVLAMRKDFYKLLLEADAIEVKDFDSYCDQVKLVQEFNKKFIDLINSRESKSPIRLEDLSFSFT